MEQDEILLKKQLTSYVYDIIGCMQRVHQILGPYLTEYVYQEGLQIEFNHNQIPYQREYEVHPKYGEIQMESFFRLDFLCKGNVIVECKAVDKLSNDHRLQLWNYMRISPYKIGILVNFAPQRDEVERYYIDNKTQKIIAF